MEEWKPAPGCPAYEVSNHGNIRNGKTKRTLSSKQADITVRVGGQYVTRSLARLVAQAFIPNPDNLPEVHNISGDRVDRRVENLRWARAAARFEDADGNRKITGGRSRPVWRVDRATGERVELYDSVSAAVRALTGTESADIYHVNLIGLGKDTLGWAWEFPDKDDLPGEQWKAVPAALAGGADGYTASTQGRIRTKTGGLMSGSVGSNGYLNCGIGCFHRIVFFTWHPGHDTRLEVNHKDGNKLNNAVNNLDLMNRAENMQHAYDTGLATREKREPVIQVDDTGNIVARYSSFAEAETNTGINRGCIFNAVTGVVMSHGFRWFKADQEDKLRAELAAGTYKRTFQRIYQVGKTTGALIKAFNDNRDAEEATGVKSANIGRATRHKKAFGTASIVVGTAGGYRWFQTRQDYEDYRGHIEAAAA